MLRRALLFAALSAIVACQNESVVPSLTEPGIAARVSLVVATTSSHAIRKVKLSVDGRDVATVIEPSGSGQVTLESNVSVERSGTHVIRVTILEQSSSPNRYVVSGSVITNQRILDLAPIQATLNTGETVEISVAF